MVKRKIDNYLECFFEQNKKALLLTGARQIGKTFSIRHFGHEHFEHFVEINGSPAKACGLSIDSRKSKQEEFSVNDTSKLRPELFDFSIERFCRSIG